MAKAWQKADTVKSFLAVRGGIPFAAEQLDVLLTVLRTADRPIRRVLDLGCGTGIVGLTVKSEYPDAYCDFVDFSEAMLAQARAAIPRDGSCHVYLGDMETQSLNAILPARQYDAVVSGFAIHHLTEQRKPALFAEIFERLAPGGVFLNMEHVASLSARSERLWNEAIISCQHAHQAEQAAAQGGGKSRETIAAEYHARADGGENILEPVELQMIELQEIGFVDVDLYFKYFELAVFGGFKPGSGT